MILNVITVVSRPENVRELAKNILDSKGRLEIRWIVGGVFARDGVYRELVGLPEGLKPAIIFPAPDDISGGPGKTTGLEFLDPGVGWVYFLDDDNYLHHDIPRVLSETPPAGEILLFPQKLRNGFVIRPKIEPMKVGFVDLGQYVVPSSVAKQSSFPGKDYESDWKYLDGLKQKGIPHRWVKDAFSWYNFLRP